MSQHYETTHIQTHTYLLERETHTYKHTRIFLRETHTHTNTHASSSELSDQVNAPAAAQDELATLKDKDKDSRLEKEVDKLRGALGVEGGAAQVLAKEESIRGRLAAKEEECNGLVAPIHRGGGGGVERGGTGQLGKALLRLLVSIVS